MADGFVPIGPPIPGLPPGTIPPWDWPPFNLPGPEIPIPAPPVGGPSPATIDISDLFGKIGNILKDIWDNIKGVLGNIFNNIGSVLAVIFTNLKSTLEGLGKLFAEAITRAIESIKDLIAGVLGSINDFLKNTLPGILKTISDAVDKVALAVNKLIEPITKAFNDVTALINRINDELIKPVVNLVTGTLNTISTLTTAIEKDLHEGLSGLLRIPSDIAGAMTSLDATMQRTVQQLGMANKEQVQATLKFWGEQEVGKSLKSASDTLSAQFARGAISTTFNEHILLHDQCDVKGAIDAFAHFRDGLGKGETWVDKVGLYLWDLVSNILMLLPLSETTLECAKEKVYEDVPITKLDIATALEAWRRGFIDDTNLEHELAVKGLDAGRRKVLRDLQTFLFDLSTVVDMWFRGIINESDLNKNLEEHGLTANQVLAIKEAALRLYDPSLAVEAYKRGIITIEQLQSVLIINRYSDAEREALIETIFRVPSLQEYIQYDARRKTAIGGAIRTTLESDPDPEVQRRGKAAGESLETTKIGWTNHWTLPSLDEWISAYFRGLRTRSEVLALMDAFHIPQEIRDDLIEVRRAIIPFRTIPGMVAADIITEERGRQLLEAHGYDEKSAFELLAYAKRQKKDAKAQTAQQLHAASLSTARSLFIDGSITVDQYRSVLREHGLSPDAIDLEVSLTVIEQQRNERKRTAQEIVDEAIAGLITHDEAQNKLARANFTTAEIAHYLRSIKAEKVKTSKVPGEAELNHMMQRSIIGPKDYTDALRSLGYSEFWTTAFLRLRTTG